MNKPQRLEAADISPYLAGGGCLLSIPVIIGAGAKFLFKYAAGKEHDLAHQVEDVELEGDAALALEENYTPKEALQRFVAKLERTTAQFQKTGAKFQQSDYERQKARLESLKEKLEGTGSDQEATLLVSKANQYLQQYAP